MAHRFKKPKPIGARATPSVPTVTLPAPSPALKRFTEYSAAQFNRTTSFLRNPLFADFIGAVDGAYAVASKKNQNVTAGRARMYLVCHQALFSAAACIARGVPLDAAAASRRALEAARTMLAMKLDPENGARWLAHEERMERHRARKNNEKPPSLKIKYGVLDGDEDGMQLGTLVGILSDGAVHFTPEFYSYLDFQEQDNRTMMFSEYLEDDDEEIARHLRMLGAVHLLILKTLDRCCDHGFRATEGFASAIEKIVEAARALFAKYPYQLRPELEEQLAGLPKQGDMLPTS
jgi:hypothetical protein